MFDDSSIGIIGGADGPTAIFIATSEHWISLYHLGLILLLLLPNILYAILQFKRNSAAAQVKHSKPLAVCEQIGRYGCLVLLLFDFGVFDFGYPSVAAFLICLFTNPLLLLLYWAFWVMFYRKQTRSRALALAILPAALFLLNGICLVHPLLIGCALLFAFCHIRITALSFPA